MNNRKVTFRLATVEYKLVCSVVAMNVGATCSFIKCTCAVILSNTGLGV